MKHIFNLSLVCFATLGISAQQLDNANSNPSAGQSFTVYFTDLTTEGASGTGVTWNFSAANTLQTAVIAVENPAGTPNGASFPGANIALNLGSGVYDYYECSASGQFRVGFDQAGTLLPYSNKETIYSFPSQYGDTYSDVFKSSYTTSGYPSRREGTLNGSVDGSGTLTTPEGTFTGVLRVRIDEVIYDTIFVQGTPVPTQSATTSYLFRKPGIKYGLYNISHITTFQGTVHSATCLETSTLSAETNLMESLRLFPNPVADQLNVEMGEFSGEIRYELVDITGRIVTGSNHVVESGSTLQVNTSSLLPGNYFIRAYYQNLVLFNRQFVK